MGHFNSFYANIPLDAKSIGQNLLNIANKYKSNPLPWNGQFSPQLVQVLLHHYSKPNDTVFDPFLGSGTTLLESGELNRQAYGTEINFAAVSLSRIYELINIDFTERILLVNEFENILIKYGILYSDIFCNENKSMVSNIERLVKEYSNSKYKILLDCYIVLIDFYKNNFTAKWLETKWFKIKELVKSLPVSAKTIKPFQADARETALSDSVIDFIITSPPYINVFNYHQQYRSSSEYLNGSVLPSAKAEIGSNRKHRINRFYTVTQYCIDMSQVFNEINRICRDGSHVIFIVGRESQVKKTTFHNGEIVSEIACACCNLDLTNKQERVFLNRFGMRIYEDILHFQSSKKITNDSIGTARKIAYNIFKSVITSAPNESQDDLRDALDKITEIQGSEIYRRQS
jgi:hypothetical protein